MVRGLAWLSDFVYRQADRVVVLGPYMGDRVHIKGVRSDRVTTIPVWSRRNLVYPVARSCQPPASSRSGSRTSSWPCIPATLAWPIRLTNFLKPHGCSVIATTSSSCSSDLGPRAEEVRSARDREGLTNVRLLDYVAREELHQSLSVADVHLISMRPEMTGIVVPGKLYGIMAAGRPALFVGPAHCESADTIRRAGCGFTIAPGDAEGVVSALTTLAADLNLAHQMGQKGRINFLATHERNLCCYQWLELVCTTWSRSPALSRFPLRSPA